MRALSHSLAVALAGRLREVVPPPLSVEVDGSGISLYEDNELLGGSNSAVTVDDENSLSFEERLEATIRTVLSDMQDDVMHYLREQWPTDGAGELALPAVRIDASRAYLWYGAREDAPAIGLRPISFDEIAP